MRGRIAHGQRLMVWALALGSVASVGLAALPVVSHFAQSDQVWQALAAKTPAAASLADRVSLQAVLDLAPFGQTASDQSEAPAGAADTPVGIALQGVVVGATPAASMAILSVDGAAAASFRIGEVVANGHKLMAVAPDHVTLDLNGSLQTLAFPDAVPSGEGDDTAAAPDDNFLRTLIPTASALPPPDTLETLRASLVRNPRALLERYGIVEQPNGYAVTDATPQDLLQIGLLPGDIITTLNGEALAGITRDGPLFDRVAASGTAQITLLRGGGTETLTVQLP